MSCHSLLLYCARLCAGARKTSVHRGAPLNTAALRRTTTIVRNRGHVLDLHNVQARSGQRPNRGFPSRARPLDTTFYTLHAVLITRCPGSGHGSLLRGIGSALARAFEADGTRGRPADRASVRGRDGHNGVVKSRLDTSQAMRHDPAFALLFELFLALRRFSCCRCCCSLLCFLGQCLPPITTRLLASHDFLLGDHGALPRTLPRARLRIRALPAGCQMAALAQPA